MTEPASVASLVILGLEDPTPVTELESAFNKDARWTLCAEGLTV